MRHEKFSEIFRPTGRIIEFTPEELEEIEQLKIEAQKDREERFKRAEQGLPY
ncbi:hypothetical protein MmiAt1_15520 [Methanimicrococcus sp. At1]|uniref:Uncharacterized protein n=1 Tax=Methanimicrococcus hacksteinii TaxID=3028293 RepID=A0ABU3VRA8_9EURY|nr:hypothetical protein [Methanimicrococcus sp. At1]MDV0445948.1 hypothetical protein [Methanimicrococcus sp. At1]